MHLDRLILMWNFSWHHKGMKEDALKKGLPVPDEAAVQELVLVKTVKAPDLTTVKDFLRFKAMTSPVGPKSPLKGVVADITRPKYLFTERDVVCLLRTPWTEDDSILIPQRYRVQFHYVFLEHEVCCAQQTGMYMHRLWKQLS